MQGLSLSMFVLLKHLPYVRFVKTALERTGFGGNWVSKNFLILYVVDFTVFVYFSCHILILRSHFVSNISYNKIRPKLKNLTVTVNKHTVLSI